MNLIGLNGLFYPVVISCNDNMLITEIYNHSCPHRNFNLIEIFKITIWPRYKSLERNSNKEL